MESIKPNWFVRVLVTLLCIILAAMILFRYFYVKPLAEITLGLITIIGFLIVLCLCESFDAFSIGKILNLSRNVKERDRSINELKKENYELRNQIVNVANAVSQHQTSNNIFGFPERLLEPLIVRQAGSQELEEKRAEDSRSLGSENNIRRVIDHSKLELFILEKYMKENNLTKYQLINEATLVPAFAGIDPISEYNPVFDGYVNTLDSEIFFEVRPSRSLSPMTRDRLYVMLSKLHYYRTIKKANAYLFLVIVDIPGEEPRPYNNVDFILKHFQPALASGILRIEKTTLSQEQANNLYKD